MRNSILLATTLVVLFLSCNRHTVSLDYTNAKDEVPQLGNLVFRFSKSLVSDSLLNRWDSTEYVSFEPKIPGRFRWESPSELVFSPSRPLQPATSYTAKIKDDILEHSRYGSVEKGGNLKFRTPDLKLENSNVTWVLPDPQSKTAVPQIDLYFNYPIKPAALQEKLDLNVEGKEVDYKLITASDNSKISLQVSGLNVQDKDYETVIKIGKGLVPEGGSNGTPETIESKSGIPSPFVLLINDVQSEHDGSSGTIYIKTSQQVLPENLNSYIKFSPAIRYSAEPTDDGFMISSDNFDAENSYELTIAKGLRGIIGGVLREEHYNQVAFGKLEPSLSFTSNKAVYLSAQGAKNIEMRIVNVPKVKVVVSKIYESNLMAAHRYGYYPQETGRRGDGDEEYYYARSYYYNGDMEGDATLGDVIYEQEIDTRSLPKRGASRVFNFNIADRLNDFKGIYHIRVRSTDDFWVSDSRYISLSDIGLIAKQGRDKIFVFTNSIKSSKPLDNVNVVVYGGNNQVLGIGSSNAEGVAEVEFTRKEFAGFKPAMVIAKTADDFTYLPFSTSRVNTSRFEVEGKRINSTGLDAFIYAERDIYRPGERVNFSVILRDLQWKSPGEIPVKLKFLLPNGKELKTFRKNLNAQGSLEGNVDISNAAITGSYSLEVYTSNDVLLASKNFNIEEFVPDRIKISTKLDKQFLKPADDVTLNINAVNFFGPPAANRNYEAEMQLKQLPFSPKKYGKYSFALTNQNSFNDKALKEGKTDAQGNAAEVFEIPEEYRNMGLLQATFYATVFDETGRPVSRSSNVNVYTQSTFFGIADDGYWYYPLNQAVRFPVIALNKDEQVLSGAQAEVKVIKHEYRTILTRNGDYFRYESQEEDIIVSLQRLTVNGENSFYPFVPRSPGEYEVRISLPGAASYISKRFYSYGWWGGDATSFEVNTEGNIDIEPDKSSYATGENVKLLFKTPFSGRLLVTLENDKVVSYQYINVEKRSATMDLKLSAEHLPNIYITATLIKPHETSDIPLTVAHGFQSIRVEERSRKLPVEIVASKSVRSRTHQKVRVNTEPNSYVTLAAVDNGVLQISDFKTPDPYGHFYAKRALQVDAYDIYPLLFPEVRARLSSTGGDGAEMEKRVNPMPAKRIKVVSYWSGIAQANGSGTAEFEFDIPQFSGEVRLMAVVYKNENFGSGESAMTVADPLVLSTALPRFLSPGDTVTVPVTVTNTTNKSTTAIANLNVTAPLRVVGGGQQTVNLSPNSENRAEFKLVAAPAVGVAKVNVQVQGLGEKFTDETEISVRPASTLQKLTGSGQIQGNRTDRINIGTSDFLQGSADYELVISRSPAMELGKQLSFLVQYPYGCTEQTISSAFPQLYFSDLADLVQLKAGKQTSISNVQEAIRKIKMRQLFNGAITLWDGEGTEHWWASVYAAHFLLEAKKAGFEVDDKLLQPIFTYLINRLRNKETIMYYYNRDQRKKIAPKEVAYSLYVLALAGKPQVSSMNYYKANPALLSLDAKYLLSAAYAVAGDRKKFQELLPTSFSGEVSIPETGGSFYSDIRDEAIALNALIDSDPTNAQIGIMARHVADKLKQRRWFSTQEASFGFLGLGKMARRASNSNVTAEVKVNGKTVGKVNGKPVKLSQQQLGGTSVEVVTKGEGQLYYFWESEGISVSGDYKEEDSYIKVRRQFYDRNGRMISGNTFSQNDLIIVKVTLEKSFSGEIENIVITDLLPAGFEIENPRTKEIPGMDWVKESDTPVSLDVRDDRIHLFVDLGKALQTYYYAVRAVSPGVYKMGPVSADAMYNGEYHSYHGGGTIKVVQ
ncbi:MAG TPA: MG2 domain-containing protein [Chitinophagaceae bacterium]|nr:MG2 domain-containing protein [Chitinophagaceae bacterium]